MRDQGITQLNQTMKPIILTPIIMLAASGVALADKTLAFKSRIQTGDPAAIFDEGAAEIAAYDQVSEQLYITNGFTEGIDIVNISDPDNPTFAGFIDTSSLGDSPTSVAVDPRAGRNEIAVAIPTVPGKVAFYTTDGTFIRALQVGNQPDMITYTPNGRHCITADEGEPNGVDPVGSVSIINVARPARFLSQWFVKTAGFEAFDSMADDLVDAGVRLFPGKSPSEDFEPEYVTVSGDSRTAYVALQEANSLAVVDIMRARVTGIIPLGVKDHSLPGNGLDGNDRDGVINIANYPIYGMFMPDGIASYKYRGQTYIVSANEGDDRGEDERIQDLDLDESFDGLDLPGRLGVSTIDGDTDGDGDYDQLFAYGSRSFTIWSANGDRVFDSGDDFEQITASLYPDFFNTDNDANDDFDRRSDNKGPEPEGVVTASIGSKVYAFIGLERIGGIMIYDVTNPHDVRYCDYVNTRNFDLNAEDEAIGDSGPEGLIFIPGSQSPNSKPLLVVTNEVSGSTVIFEIVDKES